MHFSRSKCTVCILPTLFTPSKKSNGLGGNIAYKDMNSLNIITGVATCMLDVAANRSFWGNISQPGVI